MGAPQIDVFRTDAQPAVHRAGVDKIEAVRAELAAWSAGKPKAVQNAVRNLDGWLDLAESREALGVNVLACTARAIETLRSAYAPYQCTR